MSSIKDLAECTSKCRSKRHALEMICAVTKGTLSQIKVYVHRCYNSTSGLTDPFGRNLLHIAATCGKADIVEWLLVERKFKPSVRDLESNWTALHRALFYGQLAAARVLASHVNPGLYLQDREGLSPLDLVMKDRPAYIDHKDSSLSETFSWGDNTNFTLGHSIQQRKAYPEAIDTFRREKINVVEVTICKFHTVFLTREGQVYTCGHGRGGRLGHGTEQTCVVPCLVEGLKHEKVRAIAAAVDHTLFLTESNWVYACGLNNNKLLGLTPIPDKCLSPKQIKTKLPKGVEIVGISAGRFHSVFYTNSAVYSFGLNAGQIGHQKGDVYQPNPRQVSALNQKGVEICHVASSDAATVCLTTRGDIYVLHEYRCRKIASRTLEIVKVCVSGGNLDHTVRSDVGVLRERGGKELVIAILAEGGKVFIWKESYQTLVRIDWNLGRELEVCDFTLNQVGIGLVSSHGEVFLAKPKRSQAKAQTPSKPTPAKEIPADNFGTTSLLDLLEKEDNEDYQVQRVAYIHWGLKIASDRKGHNFVVMQGQPISNLTHVPELQASKIRQHFQVLMDDANEFDTIHDVVLKVGPRKMVAHKYILAHRSDYFRKLFLQSDIGAASDFTNHQVVEIADVNEELFSQLIRFIYTDDCDLLHIGEAYTLPKDTLDVDPEEVISDFIMVSSSKKMSAYEVKQKRRGKCAEGAKVEKRGGTNPVKMLQEMAETFGVHALKKRLEAVKYNQGKIQSNRRHLAKPDIRFDRKKLAALSNVALQSEDGEIIACHKCILCARLEYFHSMLGSGWIETSMSDSLSLPVPGNVLKIIVEYLYTDTATVIHTCEDTELICNVLVVADQLLMTRLKEMCEAVITQMLTLKNAAELLEFATVYNSQQLKVACQEYISINLAAMIEARYLDVLSHDVIQELTKFYKEFVPAMERRVVTPYSDPPDIATLESLDTDVEVELIQWQGSKDGATKKGKPKRRRSRNKSISEDKARERKLSVASDISLEDYSSEPTSPRSDMDQPLLMEVESFQPQDVFSPESPVEDLPGPKSPTPFAWCAASGDAASPVGAWRHAPLPQVPVSATPLLSPTSPSLKEIMIAEETREKVAKKPQALGASGKKKRKQLFRPISLDSTRPVSEKPADADESKKPPVMAAVCPWANTNSMVQSLRDLMIDEERKSKTKKTDPAPEKQAKGKKTVPVVEKLRSKVTSPGGGGDASFVWGLPTSKRQQKAPRDQVKPLDSPPSQACSPPENPWLKTPTPESKVVSFQEIVKDQVEQRQSMVEAAEKPLHLIQMEEQAMQELLAHYKADENMDKFITVERVTTVMEAPTWVAHQKPHRK